MHKRLIAYITLILTFHICQSAILAQDLSYMNQIEEKMIKGSSKSKLETITIPEVYGRVVKKFQGKSDKTVIQIQDYHAQYDAQLQNYNILKFLTSKNNIELVALEGARGDFDLSMFQGIQNDDVRKHLALSFVRNGRLSGAEYFAIQNKRSVNLQGAEDIELYMENVDPFVASQKFKEDAKRKIKYLNSFIMKAKKHLFTNEGLRFDKDVNDFYRGSIEFTDFCYMLKAKTDELGVVTDEYKDFLLMHRTIEKQRKINFEKVEVERENIIHDIQKQLSAKDKQKMLDKALQYKLGYVSSSVFHSYLLGLCQKNHIDLEKYSQFVIYTDYVKEVEHVDTDKLFREIDEIIYKIKENIFKKEPQRLIDDIHNRVRLIEKLYTIKLKNKDLQFIKNHPSLFTFDQLNEDLNRVSDNTGITIDIDSTFSAFDEYRDVMLTFYEVAAKRDIAIAENINRLFKTFDQNEAVLVCGGFHTENLTRIFENQEISYVIIAPKIIESHVENKYLKRLERSFSPFENYMLNATHLLSVLLSGQATPVDQQDIVLRTIDAVTLPSLALTIAQSLGFEEDAAEIKSLAVNELQRIREFADTQRSDQIDRAIAAIKNSELDLSIATDSGRYDIYRDGELLIAVNLNRNDDGSISAEVEFPNAQNPSISRWLNRGQNQVVVDAALLANPGLTESTLSLDDEASGRNSGGKESQIERLVQDRRDEPISGMTITVAVPQGSVEVRHHTGEKILVPAGQQLEDGNRLTSIDDGSGTYGGIPIVLNAEVAFQAEVLNSESDLIKVPKHTEQRNYLIRLDATMLSHMNNVQLKKEVENLLLQLARLEKSRNETYSVLIDSDNARLVSDLKDTFDRIINGKKEISSAFRSRIITDQTVVDNAYDDAILFSSDRETLEAKGRTRPFIGLKPAEVDGESVGSYKWHVATNLASAIFSARSFDGNEKRQALNAIKSMFNKIEGLSDIEDSELERYISIIVQEGEKSLDDMRDVIDNLLVPITRINENEMRDMYEMMLEFERSL